MKTIHLTQQQYDIVGRILDIVHDNLTYDKEEKEYHENHEDFILTLEKGEYTSLTSALKKF